MARRALKVLIIGAESPFGGVAEIVRLIVRHLNREVIDPHVTVAGNVGPYIDGLKAHQLNYLRYRFTLFCYALKLRRLVVEEAFDLIHLHTARAGLLGCVATLGMKVRIVYTGHGWQCLSPQPRAKRFLLYWCERFICYRADLVTCTTDQELNSGVSAGIVPNRKASVIPTQLETSETHTAEEYSRNSIGGLSLNLPTDYPLVGNVGAVTRRKDPDTFVRVADLVHRQLPTCRFVWLGDGPCMARVLHQVQALGLERVVMFVGQRTPMEVRRVLRAMSGFLFTSRHECLPLALLEANAAKVPIVASDYFGVTEAVQNGVTGYTFPAGEPEAAARLLLRLLREPGAAAEMAQTAYSAFLAKRSRPAEMAKQFQEAYCGISAAVQERGPTPMSPRNAGL